MTANVDMRKVEERSIASSNVLDGLITKIEDPALRSALRDEVDRLRDLKSFGLVFERHLPETAKLSNHPIQTGSLVTRRAYEEHLTGVVLSRTANEATVKWENGESGPLSLDQLVVVARFGEPIYPGLEPINRIERGGDNPFHVVINAENYHALQLLQFTHHQGVDVIYIDPPYNTGKKAEWKYNDRWVSKEDKFRHSKWLSFMDRRLRLAKELLRKDGLLLISIDDYEFHHLRALCNQIFGEHCFQATFVWRTDGNIDNQAKIKANHEYILCISPSPDDMRLSGTIDPNTPEDTKLVLPEIRNSVVKNGPKNPVSEIELPAGFPAGFEVGTIPARDDKWPKFHQDIRVSDWKTTEPVAVRSGWANARLLRLFIENGFEPVVDRKGQETVFELTHTGAIENVKQRAEDQSHVLTVLFNMGTTEQMSNDLKRMGVSFTYPKPVRLLRYLINLHPNPNAVVLDFFAGSGSTAQAVMELNQGDAGRRQCILVTNNELEEDRATELAEQGLLPGDDDWERWGIFENVTRPRIETFVTGRRGDAHYSDGSEENIEFFRLSYQDPNAVARGKRFEDLAPVLWLRAGAVGTRIDTPCETFAAPDDANYAILFDAAYVRELVEEIDDREEVRTVFIFTDSTTAYQMAASELPAHVTPVHIYATYLRTFEAQGGGDQ